MCACPCVFSLVCIQHTVLSVPLGPRARRERKEAERERERKRERSAAAATAGVLALSRTRSLVRSLLVVCTPV